MQKYRMFEQSARAALENVLTPYRIQKYLFFESDKVNYMLSSVFFLANRLSKAIEGIGGI